MTQVKIQDVGTAPMRGRQEKYWTEHIVPKYQKLRPGFKFNYTPQGLILNEEKLNAIEFGHYTSQNDRFDFLAGASASFNDMKLVTGFKTIGLKKIGIAYGARGMGGFAAAHFEPDTFMINLTKNSGFGAFAHEYGHAIDYLFGGFIDQQSGCFSLSGGRSTATKPINSNVPGSLRFLMDMVLKKVIWKDENTHTDMYAFLKRNTQPGGYWVRRTELFARAFEQYIHYKLNERGIINTFLTSTKYGSRYYLSASDFKAVLPHMDRLVKKMAGYTK